MWKVFDGILANLPFIQIGLGCEGMGEEGEASAVLVVAEEHGWKVSVMRGSSWFAWTSFSSVFIF
eukprot:3323012-Pleurochrysis_carterae.AAC.1